MASTTILSDNGVTSGITGYTLTGGNDGTLQLQTTTAGGTATTAVTIDNSQNMGLGVTPSAWSGFKNFEVGYSGTSITGVGQASALFSTNAYYNSGWKYGGTGAATYYYQDVGAHKWYNAPSGTAGNDITWTQAMTLSTSGNLGLGVTPSAWDSTFKSLQVPGGAVSGYSPSQIQVIQNAYYNAGWKYTATAAASRYGQDSGVHAWYTAASGTAGNAITFTQAMTLDASGNLLVGTTSGSAQLCVSYAYDKDGARWTTNSTATHTAIRFYNPNGSVGTINTSGSSTSYNTSSDYRLKENIEPMTGALSVVTQLNPVTYNWKVDGSDGQGFIAHELQEVVPDCVTGEKDGTRMEQYEITPAVPATYDEEGNELTPAVEAVMGEREVPVYQGIDTSFLVATLTAAIKEQQAIITSLTERITALEGAAQ